QTQVVGSADAGSSCPLTSGTDNDSSSSPIFSAGTKSRNISFNGTFTNTGDATDTVKASGQYKATFSVHKAGQDLQSAQIVGTGSVSLKVAQGGSTGCDPEAVVEAVRAHQSTQHPPRWVYLERATPSKVGLALTEVVNTATSQPVQVEFFQGSKSHSVSRGFAKPGTYLTELVVGLTAGDVGIILKSAPRSTVSAKFYKAGS